MVDFKYHVVSLVSVFLALAVGIILGAGPLQGSIANTLTGQVDALRESRDSLRTDLSRAQTELDAANRAVVGAGEQLTAGTLTNRTVALVVAPQTPDSAVAGVREQIEFAGGKITGVVTLTENYSSAASAAYRGVLAGNLNTYVKDVPEGASQDATVAAAVDTLVRKGTADPDGKSLKTLLTSQDNRLLEITQEPAEPAQAVIFITEESLYAQPAAEPSAQATPRANITQIYADAFGVWALRGPAVAVGTADVPDSTLDRIRHNGTGSTVDSSGSALANVNAAMATASALTGQQVALGVGTGANEVMGQRVDASAGAASGAERSEAQPSAAEAPDAPEAAA